MRRKIVAKPSQYSRPFRHRKSLAKLRDDDVAMQHDRAEDVSNPIESTENIVHVDPQHRELEDVVDESTEDGESDEFAEPATDDDEREHNENSYVFENDDVENDFD
ncbi:unnamed protein product [Microthlaspi erraticum]|uniref:Uncharacterized protein n=1 Tax=Microthlaspi erraticum TaxID=1685480 RepID=A0A6D2JY57_9BRAS|nr:unnamed protein product [Microthlaspi erraticum]